MSPFLSPLRSPRIRTDLARRRVADYEDQLARANNNTYGIRAVFLREALLPRKLLIHSDLALGGR